MRHSRPSRRTIWTTTSRSVFSLLMRANLLAGCSGDFCIAVMFLLSYVRDDTPRELPAVADLLGGVHRDQLCRESCGDSRGLVS